MSEREQHDWLKEQQNVTIFWNPLRNTNQSVFGVLGVQMMDTKYERCFTNSQDSDSISADYKGLFDEDLHYVESWSSNRLTKSSV